MWASNTSISNFKFALGREVCVLLWRRKTLALLLFIAILGLGVGVLTRLTPLYESSLKLLVTRTANDQSKAGQMLANTEELQSEIEILTSREVMVATLQELALSEPDASESAARLSVAVSDSARFIQVSYRDPSPTQAAKFLETLFQKYSEHRQQLPAPVNVETALRERSQTFNQKLDEATKALKQLDNKHNLLSLTEQQNLLLHQLYEAQSQAETARTEKEALQQQISTLRSQLATQPEQVETGSVTKYGQALDKMKEELIAMEMQRTQLLQKYQPHHRLLRDHEQRIAQAKELITREEQNPPRERSFALNETRRRITNDLFQAETNLAALTQREQRLGQLGQEYKTRLDELNLQGAKKDDLERERAHNEEAYLLYQKKAQEAEINAVVNHTKGVQVSLAEAAQVNPQPISPNWPRNLSGLLLLGLLTSMGSVIAVESLQPRIRTEAGLHRRLGLEVIAKLPASAKVKKAEQTC